MVSFVTSEQVLWTSRREEAIEDRICKRIKQYRCSFDHVSEISNFHWQIDFRSDVRFVEWVIYNEQLGGRSQNIQIIVMRVTLPGIEPGTRATSGFGLPNLVATSQWPSQMKVNTYLKIYKMGAPFLDKNTSKSASKDQNLVANKIKHLFKVYNYNVCVCLEIEFRRGISLLVISHIFKISLSDTQWWVVVPKRERCSASLRCITSFTTKLICWRICPRSGTTIYSKSR